MNLDTILQHRYTRHIVMEVQDIIDSFLSMEKETEVRHRPPARTTYVFSWTDDKKKGKYRFFVIYLSYFVIYIYCYIKEALFQFITETHRKL